MEKEQYRKESLKLLQEELVKKINYARNVPIKLLLVGRTGSGKSSTVNRLVGEDIAPIGDFEPTTESIEMYEAEISGFKYQIFDTPGLCDALPHKDKDKKYLTDMKNNVGEIDLLLYITKFSDTRITRDEKLAIGRITKVFGKKIWNHTLIVFTHTRQIDKKDFEYWRIGRLNVFLREIKDRVPNANLNEQHCICIDNKNEVSGENVGLSELWLQSFLRIKKNGLIQFTLSQVGRLKEKSKTDISHSKVLKSEIKNNIPTLKNKQETDIVRLNTTQIHSDDEPKIHTDYHVSPSESIELSERQTRLFTERVEKDIFGGMVAGATIGGAIGILAGPIGVAIGAGIGAALGALAGWFRRR